MKNITIFHLIFTAVNYNSILYGHVIVMQPGFCSVFAITAGLLDKTAKFQKCTANFVNLPDSMSDVESIQKTPGQCFLVTWSSLNIKDQYLNKAERCYFCLTFFFCVRQNFLDCLTAVQQHLRRFREDCLLVLIGNPKDSFSCNGTHFIFRENLWCYEV